MTLLSHEVWLESLADAGLLNYDIEVRCTNGVATLIGQVDSPAQRQSAAQAASRVPGVTTVHNGLTVARPVAQVSAPAANRPAVQVPPMQAAPMPMQAAPMQMQAAAMPMQMPMQAGPAMMPPTAVGYAPTSYNQPHLPPYAWPSYAQYPNSAAVSYPTQYSASAWPYIGPFYPYPQVPMGWREVSPRMGRRILAAELQQRERQMVLGVESVQLVVQWMRPS
ncbi:MAG UNVERIFIED_CONTAM: BON domain-containing protein [Planctomycetaceae bacterium]|jgi:hypothetical protein